MFALVSSAGPRRRFHSNHKRPTGARTRFSTICNVCKAARKASMMRFSTTEGYSRHGPGENARQALTESDLIDQNHRDRLAPIMARLLVGSINCAVGSIGSVGAYPRSRHFPLLGYDRQLSYLHPDAQPRQNVQHWPSDNFSAAKNSSSRIHEYSCLCSSPTCYFVRSRPAGQVESSSLRGVAPNKQIYGFTPAMVHPARRLSADIDHST